MSGVVTALTDTTTGLSAASILSVVTDLTPLIVMLVPVSLGIYFLRRLVKGASRARVKF